MTKWPRCLVGAIAAAGVFLAVAAPAGAETCTLELKRLDPPGIRSTADYIYRATSSQSFFMQVGLGRTDPGAREFSAIVKKEPEKYQSEHPFRGVAKLGSGRYAFVFDSKDKESKGYDRLYFDLNCNGDLTDDDPIDAIDPAKTGRRVAYPSGYSRNEFPRVDLTIDADGTQVEYAFFFSIYSQQTTIRRSIAGKEAKSETIRYASASLNAAAYRQGEITLDGKPRRVVLLDFNSNGRFDDETKVPEGRTVSGGQLYPTFGDKLLVDPDPSRSGYRSPYDPTSSDDQHELSGLVNIDGRYYDLEVSAAGDKLTMTPSSVPLGYVTNAHEGVRAIVYSEKGVLKVSGGKSEPVALPEGDWKLLSYTIDQTGYKKPAAAPKQEKKESLLQSLASALVGGVSSANPLPAGLRYTMVSAQATQDCQAVKVREGKTVAMPFGPPYKPVVTASSSAVRGGQTVPLALSLVGSGGEVCSNMMVDGQRPGKPEFTISTPDGEEVASGAFEYG